MCYIDGQKTKYSVLTCYKLEGRGFDNRWGEIILTTYLILTAALDPGFTQPLTEMSKKINISEY
jgi:hypothetical protein